MKKMLVAAVVAAAFFSASASAQSQTPGSLLFPTSTDTQLLSWGTDTVNAFLTVHQIPTSQWTVIQQLGRQDVYDSLRAFAWLRIQEMINSSTPLTATEQYVLNKFASDATTLNVSAYQQAVNEKNRYLANKCTWQPDPDIAASAGYVYNGQDYCPSVPYNTEQYTGPPAISPPKEYFIAYGQKVGWLNPVTARPGGTRSVSQITTGGQLLLSVGISASIFLGATATILAFVFVRLLGNAIFPFLRGVPFIAWIGAGLSIAIGLIMIVVVIYDFTEDARVEAQYPQLDTDLANAIAADQYNQASMVTMLGTQSGYQLLYSTFLDEFVPTVSEYSTATLPTPNPPVDPEFVVGGAAVPSIQFTGWEGETLTLKMWGGWFISTSNPKPSDVDSPSINTRIRYKWNGVNYEAARSGGTFIAAKQTPALTDVDCLPIPSTGVSAPTDFTTCKSFTVTSLPMDLTTGTQYVSLYQAPTLVPVTDNFSPTWTDGFSQGAPRQVAMTATGVPTPTISVNGILPPGFSFAAGQPGSATLSWDGTGSTGTYTLPFQASNGIGVANASMNATVYNAVKFVQPGLTSNVALTLTAGTPYSIQVVAVGSPAPTLTTFNLGDSCGLSVPGPTTSSTLTMSGAIRPPTTFNAVECIITVQATNSNYFLNDNSCNCGFDQVQITITVVQPPSEPVLVTTTATAPVAQTTSITIETSGGTGTVQISLTQASGVQLAPPWVSLNDNGNGTATLTMTPPFDAPNTVLVPLWYRVANTAGNQATSSTDGVTVTVNKTPVFESVPAGGYTYVFSTAGGSSQNQQMDLINLGGSLTTADPLPAAITGSFFPDTYIFNLQGIARDPGYFQSSLVATNSSGSSSAPLNIVMLQPAQITSAARVNFYLGEATTFKLLASGFPQSQLLGIPAGTADALHFSGTPSDPGIELQTSDPSSGAPYYGYALLTGVPQNKYGVYPFTISAQTGNNTSLSPINQQNFQLVVTVPGDVNGDGVVNCSDVAFITSRYGQEAGMANYDYNADYNHDGVINVKDTALLLPYMTKGTRCQ